MSAPALPTNHSLSPNTPGGHHYQSSGSPNQQQQQRPSGAPRRLTIKLSGSGRLNRSPSGHNRSASAIDPMAPGSSSLARSASGGFTIRKRGSGPTHPAVDTPLQLKRSKSQRLVAGDEADSAVTPHVHASTRPVRRPNTGGMSAHSSAALERGKPSFADIVNGGVFPPGVYEFSVGTVQGVTAQVMPGGSIMYAGEEHHSISSFALAAARSRNPQRQACDGWKEVRLNGRKLEAWRQSFVRGTPPPEAPQKGAAVNYGMGFTVGGGYM